jgi:predicted ATPase
VVRTTSACECSASHGPCRLIAITGGPSAGKTTLLDVMGRSLCKHVAVLPEAASLLYRGGFPRRPSEAARFAAQRCIFRIQRELEWLASAERQVGIALCDRGTLDGLAYWPGSEASFWGEAGTTRAAELSRYEAVIHLRTPRAGYSQANPLRVESNEEAVALDLRVEDAWAGHPRRHFIDSAVDFVEKATRAIDVVRAELPECCRGHPFAPALAAGSPSSAPGPLRVR